MAHKYDLLTVDTRPGEPQKHHPWYKERLRLKFLKTSRYCTALDGARWRFVSSNIDDFRSGAPTKSHKMVLKNQVNPVPIVEKKSLESLPKICSASSGPGMIVRNPGHRTLFSKKGARQQIKQEHIDSVEHSLLQHPLALYPHLEDGIASEIADDIVDILDPEINEMLSSSEGSISISASQAAQPNLSKMECTSRSSQEILIHAPSTIDGDEVQESRRDPANMYKFPLIKTEAEKEKEMNLIASQQVVSAKQQSRVKQVTHDLVQWAEELGGSEKSAYIDEQTIKSLFGSNYESKPILMAPIQVVELTSVPPELRTDSRSRSANTASSQQRRMRSPGVDNGSINYYGYHRSKGLPWLDITVPQVVKSKYGAWYLPVNLWKLRLSDEPLNDPDLDGGALEWEQATRKLEMDEKISALHGAKLFKEFVGSINREGSMPSFLKSVILHTPPPGQARKNLKSSH